MSSFSNNEIIWKCLSSLRSIYNGVILGAIASQITSLKIVYWTIYSDAGQRKHQSSASLAFVRGIHRRPVNSPHKGPVARKFSNGVSISTKFTIWLHVARWKFCWNATPIWIAIDFCRITRCCWYQQNVDVIAYMSSPKFMLWKPILHN